MPELSVPEELSSKYPRVVGYLRKLWADACGSPDDQTILARMASDPRMPSVYSMLLKINRATGQYLHAARYNYQALPKEIEEQIRPLCALLSDLNVEERQNRAIEEMLYSAFNLARNKDRLRATKDEEVEPERRKYRRHTAILKEVAADLTQAARNDLRRPGRANGALVMLADVRALLRAAKWSEQRLAATRGPDDPLTIKNDHGDPVARGVGGTIADFLNQRFGSPLYGTAATLASVALGQDINARVVRTAFLGRKER